MDEAEPRDESPEETGWGERRRRPSRGCPRAQQEIDADRGAVEDKEHVREQGDETPDHCGHFNSAGHWLRWRPQRLSFDLAGRTCHPIPESGNATTSS